MVKRGPWTIFYRFIIERCGITGYIPAQVNISLAHKQPVFFF
jgi:hypothetical protein